MYTHICIHTRSINFFVYFLDTSRIKKYPNALFCLFLFSFFLVVLREHASAWSEAAKGHNKTTILQWLVSPEYQDVSPSYYW